MKKISVLNNSFINDNIRFIIVNLLQCDGSRVRPSYQKAPLGGPDGFIVVDVKLSHIVGYDNIFYTNTLHNSDFLLENTQGQELINVGINFYGDDAANWSSLLVSLFQTSKARSLFQEKNLGFVNFSEVDIVHKFEADMGNFVCQKSLNFYFYTTFSYSNTVETFNNFSLKLLYNS